MIVSFPYGSFCVAKSRTAERSGEDFWVAVDLITNNVDVAAGVMTEVQNSSDRRE